ncbi:hypothetical protein [Leptodesmis sp.]|uniref:hypothetical protein n=1 Tax=Leptodesmis sp. TaxID=3100501 RepID=UPI0040534AAB
MDRIDPNDRFWATNHVQSPETFASVQHYLRELYCLVQQRSPFLNQPKISKLLLEDYLPLLIEASIHWTQTSDLSALLDPIAVGARSRSIHAGPSGTANHPHRSL